MTYDAPIDGTGGWAKSGLGGPGHRALVSAFNSVHDKCFVKLRVQRLVFRPRVCLSWLVAESEVQLRGFRGFLGTVLLFPCWFAHRISSARTRRELQCLPTPTGNLER